MLRGLEWLMVPLVLALGFMLASFSISNSDYWMHLATGRLVAEGNYQFGVDPFSHATVGKYWVNHSWLYGWIVYKLHMWNEANPPVVYVKAFLISLLAGCMYLACRRQGQALNPARPSPAGWMAAIVISLALIAMAPRLLFQPAFVSFVFLGVTLALVRMTRKWPVWVLPVAVAILFALWVNMDAWFLLGPLVIALFLVGELIQRFISRTDTEAINVKSLGIALVVGLAACLLNPHHVRALTTLPVELNPNIVSEMQLEQQFRGLFMSPVDTIYLNAPELGASLPGYCYWLLAGACLVSSVLAFGRVRASLVLLWCVFLALSLVNIRLIPFFVIVAAPVTVLNIRAFILNLPDRWFGATPILAADSVPSEAHLTGGSSISSGANNETWWPGAATAGPSAESVAVTRRSSIPESHAQNPGNLTVTASGMLGFGSVMGRLATLALGLAALWAAYPGWLHAFRGPISPRRVGFSVVPEAAHRQVAERLQQWRKQGLLKPEMKGIPLHPEIGNYLAWFAPEERGFIDYRFTFLGALSADYMQIKQKLKDHADHRDRPPEYGPILRKYGASYVILSDRDRDEFLRLFGALLSSEPEWGMWFQNGNTAVFGWYDPEKQNGATPSDRLRLDFVAQALGTRAERIAPPENLMIVRELPPDPNLQLSFWDRYLTVPAPLTAPETEAALLYLDLQPFSLQRAESDGERLYVVTDLVAALTRTITTPGLPPRLGKFPTFGPPVDPPFAQGVIQRTIRSHPLPSALALMATRNALRGMLSRPNSGRTHLILALVYNGLPAASEELRQIQQVTATRQAMARLTRAQKQQPQTSQILTLALINLYRLHRQARELDLAREVLEQAVEQYDRAPPPYRPEDVRPKEKAQLLKELEELQRNLTSLEDNFQLDLEKMRKQGQPVAAQADFALRMGLMREALKILVDHQGHDERTLYQLAIVYLKLGLPDEAQRVLDQVPEQMRANFAGISVRVAIALGHYGRAGRGLEEEIASFERMIDPKAKAIKYGAALSHLQFTAMQMPAQALHLVLGTYTLFGAAAEIAQVDYRRAELHTMRAMLALEEGDVITARKYFRSALDIPVRFRGDVNAVAYLGMLDYLAEER